MIEIQGRYNTAIVYTNAIEPSARGQIEALCNQPFTEGSHIRIMPDVHAGKGATIGTTMTLTDKAVPNLVGVDIGCGMLCIRLRDRRIDLPRLDKCIREHIPAGMNIRTKPHRLAEESGVAELCCVRHAAQKSSILDCPCPCRPGCHRAW